MSGACTALGPAARALISGLAAQLAGAAAASAQAVAGFAMAASRASTLFAVIAP